MSPGVWTIVDARTALQILRIQERRVAAEAE